MKTLNKTVGKGQQSVIYSETLAQGSIKLRISIKSDSYDFQSHARIEAFSPTELKWNNLASIHFSSMKTPSKLIYRPNDTGLDEKLFKSDRDNLIQQAQDILS